MSNVVSGSGDEHKSRKKRMNACINAAISLCSLLVIALPFCYFSYAESCFSINRRNEAADCPPGAEGGSMPGKAGGNTQTEDIDAGAEDWFYNKGCRFRDAGDYKSAARMFREAAKKGLPRAQYELGRCYYNGQGVEFNIDEAVRLFTKAAEQNCCEAQFNLGLCYDGGNGLKQNYDTALKWMRRSAAGGYQAAKLWLIEHNEKP